MGICQIFPWKVGLFYKNINVKIKEGLGKGGDMDVLTI